MDFWPARARHEPVKKQQNFKGHTNDYEYNASATGPVLSTGNGASTAAVLRAYRSVEESTRKRLEWNFISRDGKFWFNFAHTYLSVLKRNLGSRLRAYPSSTLLPDRKIDTGQPIELPPHRRAEEGVSL
jgi:hypothetical protein